MIRTKKEVKKRGGIFRRQNRKVKHNSTMEKSFTSGRQIVTHGPNLAPYKNICPPPPQQKVQILLGGVVSLKTFFFFFFTKKHAVQSNKPMEQQIQHCNNNDLCLKHKNKHRPSITFQAQHKACICVYDQSRNNQAINRSVD